MESEFLLSIKQISIIEIVISLLVFCLTMIIKIPIKKATNKLKENKRKAINTVIVFIPILLAFVLSLLYYGIFDEVWLGVNVLDTATSSYFLAVAIYAVYARIKSILRGNKEKDVETDSIGDFSAETIKFVKQNVKEISKFLKVEQEKLDSVLKEIEKLMKIKAELGENKMFQDIAGVEKINKQIEELESQKLEYINTIEEKQNELENYKNTLTQ
ncbi:MAG: hypothetical protein IJB98_03705 [Clostridia bacterium]|nr:hypothetical protein [Clostridia bacterium]